MGDDTDIEMSDEEGEPKPEWPREVFIQQTYDAAAADLGSAYNPDDDDAVGIAMGESRYALEIDSWDELKLPDGYELVSEEDKAEYEAYLESKELG